MGAEELVSPSAAGAAETPAPPTPGVRLRGFAPVLGAAPHTLILGSMPGAASLAAACYYAHPRNAFWPIMGELVGAGPQLPYAERTQRLIAAGIALWDVLAECERPGSLDTDIVTASIRVNDIAGLLAREAGIERVLFNGGTAETLFRRHVLPTLRRPAGVPRLLRLPSTSPAHAARGYADKLAAWRDALRPGA